MRFDYDYVIVGGGMAADAAARGIRELDDQGSIAILSEDVDEPYERPPLTKDLWKDDEADPDDTDLATADDTGAHVRIQTRVTSLDLAGQTVTANDDDVYGYGALLLVPGGRPRGLDLDASEQVVPYRTLGGYHRTLAFAEPHENGEARHVVVVGGGFVGTELAAGISLQGAKVTLLTPDAAVGAKSYPAVLTDRIAEAFAAHGVDVVTGARATHLEQQGDGPVVVHAQVTVPDGAGAGEAGTRTFAADGVVLGLGITPSTELAVEAGLAIDEDDGGILVDENLRTSDPHVFAAGDAASYPDAILGRRRVEHVDQAQQSGHAAGHNLAASILDEELVPYTHTPFFYSDIYDLGYEAVGDLDTSLDVIEDWPDGKEGDTGVVYYVGTEESGAPGALRGVLLWNVWDSTDKARALLEDRGEPGSVTGPGDVVGKIEIPLDDE